MGWADPTECIWCGKPVAEFETRYDGPEPLKFVYKKFQRNIFPPGRILDDNPGFSFNCYQAEAPYACSLACAHKFLMDIAKELENKRRLQILRKAIKRKKNGQKL